jgi:hypothetical protein
MSDACKRLGQFILKSGVGLLTCIAGMSRVVSKCPLGGQCLGILVALIPRGSVASKVCLLVGAGSWDRFNDVASGLQG